MYMYKVLRLPLHNNTAAEDVLNKVAEEGYEVTPAFTVNNLDLVLIVAKELSPTLKEVVEQRKAKNAKPKEE